MTFADTTVESEIMELKERMNLIEKKIDYLISLLEDEDFDPEEIKELERRFKRLEKGEAKLYTAEEVLKKIKNGTL